MARNELNSNGCLGYKEVRENAKTACVIHDIRLMHK